MRMLSRRTSPPCSSWLLLSRSARVRNQIQGAAAALFPPDWSWERLGTGLSGALRRLVEFEDSRLQAAAFLVAYGCGTVVNPSANPEHMLLGFLLFAFGVVIAVLTLAGARAGRAAARMEEILRRFFF